MSIVRSLIRLFDPIEHRRVQKELKRKTATREADPEPDRPPPELRRCRVCGHEGEGRYCLRCLAETMEPRRGNVR
jgi:hypothetical protein